jgi:hypothetical protein
LDPNAVGSFTLWLCYREYLTDYAATGSASHGQDEGIPIATVEALDGQHLGAVDLCGIRARIYSQATLLEIISCLVSKIDERLSEIPSL